MLKKKSTRTPTSTCVSLLLLAIVLAFVACSFPRHKNPLRASEVFFGKRLTSVSADPYSADRFFVGTEDGIIYVYNSSTNDIDTLLTSFDRIYKVVPESSASGKRYWVGTRNRGLFLCSKVADSLVASCHFVLPASRRPACYSAYDISVGKEGTYVATSNGLLKALHKNASLADLDTLVPVHVRRNAHGDLLPMVTCDIRRYNGGTLLCASDVGVVRVDECSGSVGTLLHRKVYGISLHGQTVMALVGSDTLLQMDIQGKVLASVCLPYHAQHYSYNEFDGINSLVSDDRVQLFHDSLLRKPNTWLQLETGTAVPVNCHNVILADVAHHQTLLVGKYSIFRAANHQSMHGSVGNVTHICTDGNTIYYLVGKRLFRQRADTGVAEQIKDLSCTSGDVRFMQVLGNRLYYVDSSNMVYTARLYSSYLANSLLSFDIPVNPPLRHEATAIGTDGTDIYVGIRDGLVNLRRVESPVDSLVFINRFARDGDSLAFATLNDGVFTGRADKFHAIPGSERFPFVRDIAFVPEPDGCQHSAGLYILTNHALLRSKGGNGISVVRSATGYRRLLVTDSTHLYGVADFGIVNLTDSTSLFPDIHFEPEACVVLGGRVYAGSCDGAYVFGDDLAGGYSSVRFVTRDLFSLTNIILMSVAVCLSLCLAWWCDRRIRRKKALRSLQKRLKARVDALNKVRHLLGEELNRHIDDWLVEIESMASLRADEALRRADALNLNIQNATFKVPTLLSHKIESQIEELDKTHRAKVCDERIGSSKRVRHEGDVQKMADTIVDNECWLRRFRNDESLLSAITAMPGILDSVPGVSGEIMLILNSDEALADKMQKLYNCIDSGEVSADVSPGDSIAEWLDRYLALPQVVSGIKAYADAQYEKLVRWAETALVDGEDDGKNTCDDSKRSFKAIYIAICDDYREELEILSADASDMHEVILRLQLLNCRRDMLMAIVGVRADIKEYLAAMKALGHPRVGEQRQAQLRMRMEEIVNFEKGHLDGGSMLDGIKHFYAAVEDSSDIELLNMINLRRKKEDGTLFLSEILLVMMMADSKARATSLAHIICANEQHLRKLRRKIVSENIAPCAEQLAEYKCENESSFVSLLLGLCKL